MYNYNSEHERMYLLSLIYLNIVGPNLNICQKILNSD